MARKRIPLNRQRILEKAMSLADKKGIAALSMRTIAKSVSVEAMSLYNHVKNKDDILDGMVELVAAQIELPIIGEDWKEQMKRRALSAHAILMKHPWATMVMMSRVNIGPNMLGYVDATLGCLLAANFSYPMADHVWNTLDSYIYGFTLRTLNFPFEPDEYKDVAEEFLPQVPMENYPHLMGLSLQVIEGKHDGLHDISFGLDLILDGLEKLRENEN